MLMLLSTRALQLVYGTECSKHQVGQGQHMPRCIYAFNDLVNTLN